MTAIILPQAVTQQKPSPKMSERYVHIDSAQVVRLMESEGFKVSSIILPSGKKGTNKDLAYARHQIDFRREDWVAREDRRGGHVPRMLYTNSHDGTTAASFMLGAYSFVCSNGLVVGSTYAAERVRHAGETAQSLIGRMQALAKNTGPMFDQIDRWQDKVLTPGQVREFARLASILRWGDPHRFEASEVLHVRRPEDDAQDLWTVFSRVQENTIRGGIAGRSRTGRRSLARPLSELAASTKYNQDLWKLADEFATHL